MGGYGSGRSGGRPTVEDSLSLNLPRLFKTGWLKQGAWTSGTLRWSIVGTGEEIASIGFEARLGEKDGYIRLHWTSTSIGFPASEGLGPRWQMQPLGELARVRADEPPSSATERSQRETPRDRALSGAFALRRKLGADGGIGDYVTKPKGMHWRTFERAVERIDRAEGIVARHTVLLLDRLNRITSR